MKRPLISICLISVLIGAGYFIYKYFSEEYAPKKRREFYVSKYEKKQDEKLYKRELYHEELDANRRDEDNQQINVQPASESYKSQLSGILESLNLASARCELSLKDMFTQDSIIDSENELFTSPGRVTDMTSLLLTDYLNRPASVFALEEFSKLFETRTEISSKAFYSTIRAAFICREKDAGLYLESVFESMERIEWSTQDLNNYKSNLLLALYSSLEEDVLPDNILFVLNGLRLLGTKDKLGEDFFKELDYIYSRIAEFEDGFFNVLDRRGVVKEPAARLESYLLELELLSDDIQILIGERFSSYQLD